MLATSTPAPASRDEGPDFKTIFSPVLSSHAVLYLPNDPEYFKLNERWSNLEDPGYVAAIQPATEEDVKNIVSRSYISLSLLLLSTAENSSKHRY